MVVWSDNIYMKRKKSIDFSKEILFFDFNGSFPIYCIVACVSVLTLYPANWYLSSLLYKVLTLISSLRYKVMPTVPTRDFYGPVNVIVRVQNI